ncbi:MAG: cytochrome c oxidase accessory protein CcoG, partial [Verrucomicrobiota bacterium]
TPCAAPPRKIRRRRKGGNTRTINPRPDPTMEKETATADPFSITVETDWENFRDYIPTADEKGRRVWIYPRKPSGRFYRIRTVVSWFLLAFLFIAPFVKIKGEPLLMMNVIERKFSLFGQVFLPQDMFIFAMAMITVFVMIVLFTAVYGRIWCGWLCPQTVLMEMVFRKIEYWIEGDHHRQRTLNQGPWTGKKWLKKLTKHAIFFGLSFIIGNLLLSYIIGIDALKDIIVDPPSRHIKGLTAMVLFSLMFYGIFSRFREQACTFICPYGRFQSSLLDENSIIVAYDNRRGETRKAFSRKLTDDLRRREGIGDCIDCHLCVSVCPTGIDIRNGTQMECVNCTACIDACDNVMDKIGRPRGLIRYASLNGIEKGEKLKMTIRLKVYTGLLFALTIVLGLLIGSRDDVAIGLLRAPGSLPRELPDGRISNIYTLKVLNKTHEEMPLEFRLERPAGELMLAGGPVTAGPDKPLESALLLNIEPGQLQPGNNPVRIGVYRNGKRIKTLRTQFLLSGGSSP